MPLPKDTLLFGFEPKLTDEQRVFVNSIFDNQFTIVDAISGSGKTTLAVACARLIGKDLVYIFAPVQEQEMGFRKGTQEEKEAEYLVPLKDALLEINENPIQAIYSEDAIIESKRNKPKHIKESSVWVYPMPHIFARGTNLKNKFVIIDEAQNFTKAELKKILTRIHDDCIVVMIGHSLQCDLKNPKLSGFVPYIKYFSAKDYVKVCKLTKNFRGRLSTDADMIDHEENKE